MGKKIDLQALRRQIEELQIDKELKHDLLEAISEKKRYGLVWEESKEDAQEIMRENIPVFKEDESKRLDSAPKGSPNHVLIEGDNLNALTALTYTHAGKIDVIYIDPPYNTGKLNDFKYNDKFVDETDGYRHSKWLSFMAKRIKIAKKLLTDTGLLFISIDDNEVAQLKCLCDEVFGSFTDKSRTNCLGVLVWNLGTGTQAGHFTRAHEYVLAYAVNKELVNNFSGGEGEIDHSALKKISKKNPPVVYKFKAGSKFLAPDGTELKDEWGSSEKTKLLEGRMVAENGKLKYDVTLEAGFAMIQQMKSWYKGEYTVDSKGQHVSEFYFNRSGVLHYKKERSVINPPSVINDCGSTKVGSLELANILGNSDAFGYPKPVQLIKFLLSLQGKDISILDFFAGSGTTLHATMQLNAEDGGHRQCILVTNNENGICENVTYERNKRVIQGYTTPKGELVSGLENNNLRYYKTEFVPRENSVKNKRALMAACIDLLCIKNNIYQEVETFGGKKFKKSVLRYFKDEAGQMLMVFDERVVSVIIPMIAEVATKECPLKVYVYGDGAYAYEDEFREVLPVIELSAMPDAFIQALRTEDVLPEKEFYQEQIDTDIDEAEVKEALSDTYNYVAKEGENDND